MADLEPITTGAPPDAATPEPHDLGRRARRGIGMLFGRQMAGQLITLAGGIALARLLSPEEFAVFAICVFFQELFGKVSNAGLASALVQQPATPTRNESRVAFTTQLVLVTAVAVVALAFGPWLIESHPQLRGRGYGGLFIVLVASMWIGALRSTPAALLERDLRYGRLGAVELLEVFANQVASVGLAFAGWGVWALAAGVLTRAVVGTVAVYAVAGWRPGLAWDRGVALRLFRFGAPLQVSGIVQQLSRGVPALVIAPVVGARAFGLMLWGATVGGKFLFLLAPLQRVAYPHLCRLSDPARLASVYGRYLGVAAAIAGVWVVLVDALGDTVLLALYGAKWAGGLPAATLYSAAAAMSIVDAFGLQLVNATGRPMRGLAVTTARTAFAYVLAAVLVGYVGLGILSGPCTWLTNATLAGLVSSALAGRGCLAAAVRVVACTSLAVVAALGANALVEAAIPPGAAAVVLGLVVALAVYGGCFVVTTTAEARRWVLGELRVVYGRCRFGGRHQESEAATAITR